MAFIRIETWPVERAWEPALRLPRWLSGRAASRSAALALSLVVDFALVGALILAGEIEMPIAENLNRSIATFDLPSPDDRPAGAGAFHPEPTPVPPLPRTDVEVTKTPAPPTEWAVTTLPPLPAPPVPQPVSPTPTSAPAAGKGSARTGPGLSGGYDPYAFASYQRPSSSRLAVTAASPLKPSPEALSALEALLRRIVDRTGIRVTLHLVIDRGGHVVRVDGVDPLAPDVAARVAQEALGLTILGQDAARPPSAAMTIPVDL